MGVPAFFRWLSKKYPSVICDCIEEKAWLDQNGHKLPIDTSKPNPNGLEFDNLYLDMNGIIHPCTHPEDRPAPKNEDEMMVAIFEFIDRIFAIVRPRRVLYMAIDGVAPRAKMNQQRSRRFRASKETAEKIEEMSRIRSELLGRGAFVPPEKSKGEHFDSNCITPGTPFMHRLSICLHYYIHDRLRNDPGWKNISVILSDANVPGEGEHKIMDYIRRQRAQPNHDPNTRHVLCGADADLIMLGLATHEPHFTIIREEFKPNKPRPCDICGQLGHEMKDCQGTEREKSGEHDEIGPTVASEQQFIFVRLYVLREYLARELSMPNLPFPYDLERAIDDWVFMCFFVGNDFLPHLPSLEIREGAIDRLVNLYKQTVYQTKGWVTESGFVNLERVQMILNELGHVEDQIFKKRQQDELQFRRRMRERNRRSGAVNEGRPAYLPQGQFAPRAVGVGNNSVIRNAHSEVYQTRVEALRYQSNSSNAQAAVALKAMLRSDVEEVSEVDRAAPSAAPETPAAPPDRGVKRKRDDDDDDDDFSHDEVRLWEDGFKERYYESKFSVPPTDEKFRSKVACEYVRGLCWVLQYYYQGCPSWKWYFPYHYAPFASDFQDISSVQTVFEKGTKPFSQLEQLMGVFPAASRAHVPEPWGVLMTDPESPIIDFYPEDFKIDLNGKKFAWQGVALLPFVDENRLKQALKPLHAALTAEERARNTLGADLLYVSKHHGGHDFLRGLYEGSTERKQVFEMNHTYFHGVTGTVLLSRLCVDLGGTLDSPVQGLPDLFDCRVVCVEFKDPHYDGDFKFPAVRLPNAKEPPPVLKPEDFDEHGRGPWRPQIGMAPMQQRASIRGAGQRMVGHYAPRPSMNAPFPRPSRPMATAAAYFEGESHYHQTSRQAQRGGRGDGRDGRQYWDRSSDGGPPSRGNYGPSANTNHGYGYPSNRYQQSGPQAPSNYSGRGGYGDDHQHSRRNDQHGSHAYGQRYQPYSRPQAPYQNNRGGASGQNSGGYGYYTSGYQGQRF